MAERNGTAPRPVLAALAVMVHDERVLLVRRRNPPDAGLWGYPGGKVEAGESVAAAALRELQEETGIRAMTLGLLDGLDVIDRAPDGGLQHHYFLAAVQCSYLSGVPLAADDAEDARWWPIGEVLERRLAMSAQVDRLLAKALEMK